MEGWGGLQQHKQTNRRHNEHFSSDVCCMSEGAEARPSSSKLLGGREGGRRGIRASFRRRIGQQIVQQISGLLATVCRGRINLVNQPPQSPPLPTPHPILPTLLPLPPLPRLHSKTDQEQTRPRTPASPPLPPARFSAESQQSSTQQAARRRSFELCCDATVHFMTALGALSPPLLPASRVDHCFLGAL